jgi:DNA primase
MDEKGRVRGFGGRTLFGEEPKYINSPDTVWFHKGDLLFGFPYAQEGFLKRKRAILCEGYFDVLRFHLKGFLEAVAPMGTALTLRQAGILSSRVEKVYLAYDRDLSGWRAGLKSFASLLSRGVEVYLFPLQEGKDPDEGLKDRSSEEIEELLSKAPPFWEEVLTFYGKGKESLQEKHRALGELLDLLKEVEDTTFVELALSDLSKVFSISLSSLKDRWEKVSPRKREKRFASEQTLEPLKEEPKGVERILCHLIVKEEIDRFALYRRWESAPLHPWFKALLRGEFLESPLYREFVARLKMTDPPLLRPGGVDTLCEEMERELALRRKKEEVKKLLQTS